MSRDILLASSFSAVGAGMYGLYYAWKLQQTQEVLKKETEVQLTEDEKTCIKKMLDSDMVRFRLDQLVKLMKIDYGYDITNDTISEESIQTSVFDDYAKLFEYFILINKIKKIYKEYTHQRNSLSSNKTPFSYSANNQEFIHNWLNIFKIKPSTSNLKYNIHKIELDILSKAASATINFQINKFLFSNEWEGKTSKNYGELLGILKEKKCIDLDVTEAEFEKTVWIIMLEADFKV